MDPLIGAALIGGGASLLGGVMSSITGSSAQQREYERQKEFAQNGISWKVADAKRAGLHPLAALGTNVTSYSPQAAVGTDYGLSDAGQNVSRAIEAGADREQRKALFELEKAKFDADVENQQLQNQYLRQQINGQKLANVQTFNHLHGQTPPPRPSGGHLMMPGQSDSGSPQAMKIGNKYALYETMQEGVYDIGPDPDYKGAYEDVLGFEYVPVIESMGASSVKSVYKPGKKGIWHGHVFSPFHGGWINVKNKPLMDELNEYLFQLKRAEAFKKRSPSVKERANMKPQHAHRYGY